MTRGDFIHWFSGELARAAGALIGGAAIPTTGAASDDDGFVVTIEVGGGGRGELQVFFARAGAEAITRSLNGLAAELGEVQILECLRALCGRTSGAFDSRAHGITLVLASASASPALSKRAEAVAVDIAIQGLNEPLHVLLGGDVEIGPIAEEDLAFASDARVKTLDVIMDIDLPLVVRFGRTELPLKALTALGPGSLIDLGRAPDEPVDVLISNRVVARGEVVIVAGNYGVRVRDVVSAAERARSLEAELA
jgi:flagellar motor switch protein FliN